VIAPKIGFGLAHFAGAVLMPYLVLGSAEASLLDSD
jgi:hypothetical protein